MPHAPPRAPDAYAVALEHLDVAMPRALTRLPTREELERLRQASVQWIHACDEATGRVAPAAGAPATNRTMGLRSRRRAPLNSAVALRGSPQTSSQASPQGSLEATLLVLNAYAAKLRGCASEVEGIAQQAIAVLNVSEPTGDVFADVLAGGAETEAALAPAPGGRPRGPLAMEHSRSSVGTMSTLSKSTKDVYERAARRRGFFSSRPSGMSQSTPRLPVGDAPFVR